MSNEDYLFEERAGMMGKITKEIPIFKLLCQLDCDSGFLVGFLDLADKLTTMKPKDAVKEIVILQGRTQFVEKCDILTRLSGIQGDPRTSESTKGLRDDLNKRLYSSTSST